jgi:hypothetical protein
MAFRWQLICDECGGRYEASVPRQGRREVVTSARSAGWRFPRAGAARLANCPTCIEARALVAAAKRGAVAFSPFLDLTLFRSCRRGHYLYLRLVIASTRRRPPSSEWDGWWGADAERIERTVGPWRFLDGHRRAIQSRA